MGNKTSRRRSIFWPVILISVGIIWLLGNAGVISATNLLVLFRLWPLFLIAIGLELLFGRSSRSLSALTGVGTVVLIIVLMIVGPSIGLVDDAEIVESTFSEPLDDAQSASITLDLSVGVANINALTDSTNLIEADLNHIGDIDFQVAGERSKIVSLSQSESRGISVWPFAPFFPGNDTAELRWDIGLSPNIPLELDVRGGVGETNVDLRSLQIDDLTVNVGVGEITLELPATDEPYLADVNAGVGKVTINIEENASVELTIDGGVGEVTINIPDNAAVRVNADSGLGDVNVPRSFEQISGNDNDEGIWETEGFASAEHQITIKFAGGIGNLNIR
jgi:hypothetical protein